MSRRPSTYAIPVLLCLVLGAMLVGLLSPTTPASPQSALAVGDPVVLALIQSWGASEPVAGPGLVDEAATGQQQFAKSWTQNNDGFGGVLNLSIQNLGDTTLRIWAGSNSLRDIPPGRSWFVMFAEETRRDFSYEVLDGSHAHFLWKLDHYDGGYSR